MALPGLDHAHHLPAAARAPAAVQAGLLLDGFRYEWGFGLLIFGIHLVLLAYLVYRSGYIPRIMGVVLGIAGVSWVVNELGPFFCAGAGLGFLATMFSMELVFMLWLLIRGRKIRDTRVAG